MIDPIRSAPPPCALSAEPSRGQNRSSAGYSVPQVGQIFGADTLDALDPEDLVADEVEIDHVFPLSAAWDLGAHSWDDARRLAFANDPRNLVAVHRSVNQQKSDQLPAQWLPPDPAARCWYVQRLAEVAAVYGLALPGEDARVMRAQCRSGVSLGG